MFKPFDHWRYSEKCGIFGFVGTGLSTQDGITGLSALEHRGNGPAGYVSHSEKGNFKVAHADTMDQLQSPLKSEKISSFIGHNRYATSASTSMENTQPFLIKSGKYSLSLAHNGNLPEENVAELRKLLKKAMPDTASDSAVLAQLLIEARLRYSTWQETFLQTLTFVQGAFSLLCITDEGYLYAIRDPYGIRPLCVGQKTNAWVVASETVALDAVGAEYQRELLAGEMVCLMPGKKQVALLYALNPIGDQRCLLETIYFSTKKSFDGRDQIVQQRQSLGKAAGRRKAKKKIPVDWIVPILNSGAAMARGASEELKIPLFEAIGVNGKKRSFIQNTPQERAQTVYEKHVVFAEQYQDEIAGKRILLCDDSLVRGTSLSVLIERVKSVQKQRPSQIHILLGSEPVVNLCNLGIDLPRREDLLAFRVHGKNLTDIEKKVAKHLGVDSVTYLNRESIREALHLSDKKMCFHCFGGPHPLVISGKPLYRAKIRQKLEKQKVLFFASGTGTHVENFMQMIEEGVVIAQPIGVITNNSEAGVIERASKFNLPVKVLSSKGRLGKKEKRDAYEGELLKEVVKRKPDVIVLAGWMLILSDQFLQPLIDKGVKIINLHPALLSGKGSEQVHSSKGLMPELRGAHAIEDAHEHSLMKLPVTGSTVHQVLIAGQVDTGNVIIKEEVIRRSDETVESLTIAVKQAEYRIYPLALQQVLLENILLPMNGGL